MKRCKGCGKIKPLSEFYKHKGNPDGHSYKCAECMLEATKKYQKTERGQKISKAYNQSEKAKRQKDRYQKSKRGRMMRRLERKRNKLHIQARRKINNSIRDGKFPKPIEFICELCGEQATEYHHYNGYDPIHWLDVVPLCFRCHRIVDINQKIL